MSDEDGCNEINSVEHGRAMIAKLHAEVSKIEAETFEINKRLKHWYIEILAKPLLMALISAVIAGVGTWKFGLDAAKSLQELNEKQREALKAEKEYVQKELDEAKKQLAEGKKKNSEATVQLGEAEQKRVEAEKQLVEAEQKLADADRMVDLLRLKLGRLQASANNTEAKYAIEKTADSLAESQQAQTSTGEAWFAVVASTYSRDEAIKLSSKFASSSRYKAEIYNATDDKGKPVYAVTLGGKISKENATQIIKKVRENGLAKDAFAWHSSRWTKEEF